MDSEQNQSTECSFDIKPDVRQSCNTTPCRSVGAVSGAGRTRPGGSAGQWSNIAALWAFQISRLWGEGRDMCSHNTI